MKPRLRMPKKTTATKTQKMLLLKSRLYCSDPCASTFTGSRRKSATRTRFSSRALKDRTKFPSETRSKLYATSASPLSRRLSLARRTEYSAESPSSSPSSWIELQATLRATEKHCRRKSRLGRW